MTQYPTDIWAKRAYAWVMLERMKQNNSRGNHLQFQQELTTLLNLDILIQEALLLEQIGWQMVKMSYALLKKGANFIPIVVSILNDFHIVLVKTTLNNADLRSALIGLSVKVAPTWDNYSQFLIDINFLMAQPKDYQKEIMADGKAVPALMERVMIAIAKKLLLNFKQQSTSEQVYWIETFEKVYAKEPTLLYVSYYLVKLLLELQKKDYARKTLLPFVRTKSNEFWVWELLAQCTESSEQRLAFLSKALLCKSPKEFLVGVKLTMAIALKAAGYLAEAKMELMDVVAIRKQKGWIIPLQVEALIKQEWFNATIESSTVNDLYVSLAMPAQDTLYEGLPSIIAVITDVNIAKKWLNYTTIDGNSGGFPYSKLWNKPIQGQLINLFMKDLNTSKIAFVQVCTQEMLADLTWIESFEGSIKIAPSGFGFVGNVYIPAPLVKDRILTAGQIITGTAVKAFDQQKNRYGRKAFQVELKNI